MNFNLLLDEVEQVLEDEFHTKIQSIYHQNFSIECDLLLYNPNNILFLLFVELFYIHVVVLFELFF